MWKCIEKTDATGKNMQTQYTKTGNWTSKLLYSKYANHLICDDIVPCCSSFHSFSMFIEKKKFKYDINPALTILHRITCVIFRNTTSFQNDLGTVSLTQWLHMLFLLPAEWSHFSLHLIHNNLNLTDFMLYSAGTYKALSWQTTWQSKRLMRCKSKNESIDQREILNKSCGAFKSVVF